jgi:membrane associated rhomboid family serine protease
MPHVTAALIALTVAIYAAGNPLSLALWPIPSAEFRPWQLFSYAFVHGGLLHVSVNLLALVSFGPSLERAWGRVTYLSCYLLSAAVGGALHATFSDRPVIGASGALFGLFAAWTVANPRKKIISIIPWPLQAWQVLVGYVIVSAVAWAVDWMVVAHAAHLGGVAIGLAFAINNKPRR